MGSKQPLSSSKYAPELICLCGKNSVEMFRGVKVFDIFALFLLLVFMFNSVVYFEFDSDGMGPSSTLSVSVIHFHSELTL